MDQDESCYKLEDYVRNQMEETIDAKGEDIDLDKLTKAYSAAMEANLNARKADQEFQAKLQENSMKEKELQIRSEELVETKKHNFWQTIGTILPVAALTWLTLVTQKRDQDFQKEGFGYDNETSKRSSNIVNDLTKFLH